MKRIILILQILFFVKPGMAQEQPVFKLLRYDEDYSYLKNDSSKSYWYKRTKFQPISKNKNTYFSFGGDYRYQYFYFKNEGWGTEPEDKDGYLLSRFLGHADFHTGKHFRTFVQLQSSLANGKINSSPVDENQLELHQLFVDGIIPMSDQKKITLRIGRQELSYGSQRLVSVREGPNNRQAFDAAKVIYSNKHVRADFFFSHYVRSKRRIFDDGFNHDLKLWGAYGGINKVPGLKNIDVYYLGLWKRLAGFDDGTAKEARHSIGTRVWNKTNNWEYDFETLYQWGKFGNGSISAWTISTNTSYSFPATKFSPLINLKTDLISGDRNYDDRKLNTFNPLFPRGAYFGYAALIGPSNLFDIHPSLAFSLAKTFRLTFDYVAFWRLSINDGVYGPSGAMIFSGKNTRSKFIGGQFATDIVYTPSNFLYFRGEFTWFNAGKYLDEANAGKDILFTGVTMQFRF